MKKHSFSVSKCIRGFAIATALCIAHPITSFAQLIPWNTPVLSTPAGATGSATPTGDGGLSLNLSGGTDVNGTYILLSSSQNYGSLNFTNPTNAQVTVSSSISRFGGAAKGNQVLYFTLTPTAQTLPYNLASGISLELRSNGAFSLGIAEGRVAPGQNGWISREKNTILASSAADSSRTYTGFELSLTSTSFTLTLYTTSTSYTYTDTFANKGFSLGSDWGDLGASIVLQKVQGGSTTTAYADLNGLNIGAIPESSTTAALFLGSAVLGSAAWLSRKSARSNA